MLEAQKLDSRTMQASSVRPRASHSRNLFPYHSSKCRRPSNLPSASRNGNNLPDVGYAKKHFSRCKMRSEIVNQLVRSFGVVLSRRAGLSLACGANPAFTSQDCSRCRHRQKIPIGKPYICAACGLELNRDVNAALNILRLGQGLPLDEGNAVARLQRLQKPPALALFITHILDSPVLNC